MSNHCESCEFRKFCAMSEIVNGCSRYKEDTTTNEQWLRRCSTEELAEALLNIMANNEFALYLIHTEKRSVKELKDAVVEWLKQPHTFK